MKIRIRALGKVFGLYLLFCLIGALLEWGYGAFWDLVGTCPWTYPDSPWRWTSPEGLPLWGVAGWLIISLYYAIGKRQARALYGVLACLVVAVLEILIISKL